MLFSDGRDPAGELRRLITASREALSAMDSETITEALWELGVVQGAPWMMRTHLRSGALPPAAFELACGAAAIGSPSHRSVRPIWDAALDLAEGEHDVPEGAPAVLDEEAYRELAALLRDGGSQADADEYRAELLADAEAQLAEHRKRLLELRERAAKDERMRVIVEPRIARVMGEIAELTGHSPRPVDPALVRAADRVAPLGAGDVRLEECAEDRPMLYHNRACGPAWEGLVLAIDAAAGGSHLGLDRLGLFAQAHERLAWAQWLDEAACRLAGLPRQADARRRLERSLEGDAPHLVTARQSIARARSFLEGEPLVAAQDAWLRVSAAARAELELPERKAVPLAERKQIDEAAKLGDPLARMIVGMGRDLDEIDALMRAEAEHDGPFYGLGFDPSLTEALEPALGAMLAGFRALYGRDVAREALAQLV